LLRNISLARPTLAKLSVQSRRDFVPEICQTKKLSLCLGNSQSPHEPAILMDSEFWSEDWCWPQFLCISCW